MSVPGLPSPQQLNDYEIWDSYFTPAFSATRFDGDRVSAEIERTLPTLTMGGIKRACIFPHVETAKPNEVLKPFKRWPKLLLGMIVLNTSDVKGSLEALDRWVGDGPMLGVYFPSGPRKEQCCAHPNFHPLVERIAELKGVIMQHTWFITGGKRYGGQSTPAEMASLAARYPEMKFICAHAGGEWEKGIRAVRSQANVLVETSGFDATAGFIEMAARELGAERIVFGSHLPSRSLGTELGKIVAAEVEAKAKHLMLGENYRRLLAPIAGRKGLPWR
ncbi:MAG: amidohydrolase family protein [Limisphaerales bacterium]